MAKRYRRLRGNTAYYPFAARTGLRARQRRQARWLRLGGVAALALAAALLVRQTVFHGGQPTPPAPVSGIEATGESGRVTVVPIAATRDALAGTEAADAAARQTSESAPTPAPGASDRVLPQYRALYAQNSDMVGWLRIDGTEINLPVVQTPGDNEHYLRRGFDGLYATGGTLFLDENCSIDPEDPTANWLIYGHNMADGSMFGELTLYREQEFWQQHPTFSFDTLYETGTWQVVATLDTTLGADALPYYTFFDAATKQEWQERVDAILDLALYDTGVTPEYGQQLLTLSTCGDTKPATETRFALLAVRVDD